MASLPENVHVSTHPCLQAKLSQLRSASTSSRHTKQLVNEIATIIGCEALAKGLSVTETGTDVSPLGYEFTTYTTSPSSICLVPILRSGLSMVEAVQSLLPAPAPVHHLGLYREPSTLQPVEYYNNLHTPITPSPSNPHPDAHPIPSLALLLDPLIATGSTVCAAIDSLRDWGVARVISLHVLASREGLAKAVEAWPEGVEFWIGGIEEGVDERGMLRPGVGDVGDRLFGAVGK
ncbi:hypothetical protein LTR95_005081 [Oleoguttula sp. CCFEE 5521]